MDIEISKIKRLDEGIPFGNCVIGVAQISKIKLNPDESLEDFKHSGMVFDVTKEIVDGKDVAKHDFSKLDTARNYVLYTISNEGEYAGKTVVLENTRDIVDVFGLPIEEADIMMKNLPALAMQRQMCIVTYHNPSRDEDSIIFVPDFDAEVNEDLLNGDPEAAAGKIAQLMNDPRSAEYRTQLLSHSFIKMLLYTLVETGQKRYNFYHVESTLKRVAKELTQITYYGDGKLHTPSVSDIEGYLSLIKQEIMVQPVTIE